MSSFYGKELAVREKCDSEYFASLPVLAKAPEKGARPDPTIDRDKQTINTTAGMEYSTDGGKIWTKSIDMIRVFVTNDRAGLYGA